MGQTLIWRSTLCFGGVQQHAMRSEGIGKTQPHACDVKILFSKPMISKKQTCNRSTYPNSNPQTACQILPNLQWEGNATPGEPHMVPKGGVWLWSRSPRLAPEYPDRNAGSGPVLLVRHVCPMRLCFHIFLVIHQASDTNCASEGIEHASHGRGFRGARTLTPQYGVQASLLIYTWFYINE